MQVTLLRILRTLSSERYVVRTGDEDSGSLDLHYLSDGTVQATFAVFEGSAIKEEEIGDYISHFDEILLPEVSLQDKRLLFTVIIGRTLGAYDAVMHTDVDSAPTH